MGKKEFGIFELAELFGITPEAIRKYESKNIIQPYRDGENKYRKFGTWELIKMIWARSLSLEGFGLKQISDWFESEKPESQLEQIEALQENLTREIVYRKRLIRRLDKQKKDIHDCLGRAGRLQVEHVPALYCCVIMDGATLVDKQGKDRENLKQWIQALPFASVAFMGNGAYENYSCLVTGEEEREIYGLQHLEADFVIPEKMYVIYDMIAEHCDEYDTSREVVLAGMEKARNLGFELEDQWITCSYAYTQKDGVYQSYIKGMFPIVT